MSLACPRLPYRWKVKHLLQVLILELFGTMCSVFINIWVKIALIGWRLQLFLIQISLRLSGMPPSNCNETGNETGISTKNIVCENASCLCCLPWWFFCDLVRPVLNLPSPEVGDSASLSIEAGCVVSAGSLPRPTRQDDRRTSVVIVVRTFVIKINILKIHFWCYYTPR